MKLFTTKEYDDEVSPNQIGRIPFEARVETTEQLGSMLKAGVGLSEAVKELYEQAVGKRQQNLKRALGYIQGRLQNGDTFAEAAVKVPTLFPAMSIAMLEAGEEGGSLPKQFLQLAASMRSQQRLMRKVRSAMMMPSVVLAMTALIATGLVMFVVPKIKDIFDSCGGTLPLPTRVLLAVSQFMVHDWYLVLLALGGLIALGRWYLRSEAGSKAWDKQLLRLPIIGPLAKLLAMTRFALTFAQMKSAGVGITQALQISSKVAGNQTIASAVLGSEALIQNGMTLSEAFARFTVFDRILICILRVGDVSGNTDEALQAIAKDWQAKAEDQLAGLSTLLEPVLTAVMGLVIGSILTAIYLPIFKMGEVIAGH